MNPYIYEVCCSVCGGPGMAHARDIGKDWTGSEFVHSDPRVCRDFLDRENIKNKKKEDSVVVDGGFI